MVVNAGRAIRALLSMHFPREVIHVSLSKNEQVLINPNQSEDRVAMSGKKVKEFLFWSGNFKILLKVREKSGNPEKNSAHNIVAFNMM